MLPSNVRFLVYFIVLKQKSRKTRALTVLVVLQVSGQAHPDHPRHLRLVQCRRCVDVQMLLLCQKTASSFMNQLIRTVRGTLQRVTRDSGSAYVYAFRSQGEYPSLQQSSV
jgi:hypothetical protein